MPTTDTMATPTPALAEITDYFRDSGDAIRCFYEEEARTPDGALTVPKERAINKIGHALH